MAQILKGKVVSSKNTKTVVVEVINFKKHPRYGKFMRKSKKYKAHTETPVAEGSEVSIVSTRPISKDKKWKVII